MASGGKKKTTMAKLMRESRLRERRLDKQAKKEARKLTPAHRQDSPGDTIDATIDESSRTGAERPGLESDERGRVSA